MSTPTHELKKLSIGGPMSGRSRSEAQQERRRKERQEGLDWQSLRGRNPPLAPAPETTVPQNPLQTHHQSRQRRQEAASAPPPPELNPPRIEGLPENPISGHTGISYDVSSLEGESYQSAVQGLKSKPFIVHFSRLIPESRHIAFQVSGLESVRIFSPEKFSCTCGEYRSDFGNKICTHIYWLYDALNGALAPNPIPTQNTTREAIQARFSEFYTEITANMENITEKLNGIQVVDDEAVKETIKDMLSVLVSETDNENDNEPEGKLWDEFEDEEIFHSSDVSHGEPLQSLITPGNIIASLASLARYDLFFRERLRQAIPKELCAQNFLDKIKDRKDAIFQEFDDYTTNKPRRPRVQDFLFVQNASDKLRTLQSKLAKYAKGFRAPMEDEFYARAAEISIGMIIGACRRNNDMFAVQEDRRRQQNLYLNLIADPQQFDEGSVHLLPFRHFFALEDLEDWSPGLDGDDVIGQLQSIRNELKRMTPPASEFISRLKKVIQHIQTSELSGTEDIGVGFTGPSVASPTESAFSSRSSQGHTSAGPSEPRRLHLKDPRDPQRRRFQ